LGHRLPLTRNIRQGEVVRWSDVDLSRADALTADAIAVRRAMESQHGAPRLKDRPQAAE
jgi:hypothetical protein